MQKCNPLRWMWGLLPLIAVLWVATLDLQRRIEVELEQRANEHLARNNLGWATVAFTGRDGVILGRAEEESDQRRPAIEVAKLWGVRNLEDRIEVLQFVKSYVWHATAGEGVLALSGYVPNEAARKAILASVRTSFPKHKVEDKMDLARGAPEQKLWLTGAAFALRQLAALKPGGKAGLEAAGLVLEGEADSSKGYETMRGDLARSLPPGITVKTDRVIPPVVKPFTWAASLRGRQIELTGHAPSVSARDQIKAAAAAGGATVTDRMTIASGAPNGWQNVAVMALARLGQLKQGSAEMTDSQLTLGGLTDTEAAAEAVRAALKKDTPPGFRLIEQVRQDPAAKAGEEAEARRRAELNDAQSQSRSADEQARKAKEEQDRIARARSETEAQQRARAAEAQRCERDLSAAAEAGTISFQRASTELDKASHRTLDALAQIIKGCPGHAVEVAGHTDNEGEADRNKRLSERRAQSVLEYLVGAGVPAATLSAAGYGDARPKAPNDSAANKARNRRIEFSVKPK